MKIKKYKSGEIGYWRTSLTLGALILTQLMTYGAIKYKTADKITSYFIPTGGDDDTEVVDRTEPEKKPPPPVIPEKIKIVEDKVEVKDPPPMSNEDDNKNVKPIKPAAVKKPIKKKPPTPEKIHVRVQKMPQFPGGDDALRTFLGDNLSYPDDATDLGLTKTIMVKFIVRKDGKIDNIKILNKPDDYGFSDEAKRVVKLMAQKYKYTPGEQGNKKVSVWYNLPIVFVPDEDDDDF